MTVSDLLEQPCNKSDNAIKLVTSCLNSLFQSCYNNWEQAVAKTTCWQLVNRFVTTCLPISFPEHARSQVKGGHSSGEIELIQACDWLTADSTLDFQRKFYACLTIVAKYKQSIWNFSSKIWYFLHWNRLENSLKFWGKYVRKLRIDRDTTTWKIQGELQRFERRRFDLCC
jgi:hypothetical protein